jgi:hypothetical protein
MATININDVVKEVNTYLAHNPTLISVAINRAESVLDKHTKPLTKIKGQFPQGHTLLSNVVQGFSSAGFNELGAAQIEHKILKNYHQKVNFALVPADILSSYWADLYTTGQKPEDMPIAKYIIENELLPKVIDNLATLSVKGVYDPARLAEFGFSMNGIEQILTDMLAQNPATATDHTPFRIPLNALTDVNMVGEITAFERGLPSKTKSKVKKIFMSENNVERYILDYEEKFGQNKFQNDALKTRLGKREIIGIPGMDSDLIFATTEDNFRRLIDVFDGAPAVSDVQKENYKVKIFMEFWKGYDFLINQLVYVSNFTNATKGLGSTALNQKYYGEAYFTAI